MNGALPTSSIARTNASSSYLIRFDSLESNSNDDSRPRKKPIFKGESRRRSLGTRDAPIELSDSEPVEGTLTPANGVEAANSQTNGTEWTPQTCLQRTLEIFPDISHEYVFDQWSVFDEQFQGISALNKYQAMLENIFNNPAYPKEKDRKHPHPMQDNETSNKFVPLNQARLDEIVGTRYYHKLGASLLKAEFPDIPVTHIKITLSGHKRVHDAYLELYRSSDMEHLPYQKTKHPRKKTSAPPYLDALAQVVYDEISTARHQRELIQHERNEQQKVARLEEANDREAREAGNMLECGCCFTDVAFNRMAGCNSPEPHYFCYVCTKKNVEVEVGNRKCRPKCMDISGCDSTFAEQQLRLCVDVRTLDRLLRLQQQDDLKAANIEGLTECPFCDYMAVCPSALIDREFRCENPDCKRVSCRLCNFETHIPLSCESAAKARDKDSKIGARHIVEEAMTDALVRNCNKCKNRFVKEQGCNKMSCPTCGNSQCYVCSANIKGYDHFSRTTGDGKCQTHDAEGVEVRHQEEVKRAEEVASAKIRAERPEIAAEDLTINVSDRVKKAEEEARKRPRAGPPPGFMGHLHRARMMRPHRRMFGFERELLGNAQPGEEFLPPYLGGEAARINALRAAQRAQFEGARAQLDVVQANQHLDLQAPMPWDAFMNWDEEDPLIQNVAIPPRNDQANVIVGGDAAWGDGLAHVQRPAAAIWGFGRYHEDMPNYAQVYADMLGNGINNVGGTAAQQVSHTRPHTQQPPANNFNWDFETGMAADADYRLDGQLFAPLPAQPVDAAILQNENNTRYYAGPVEEGAVRSGQNAVFAHNAQPTGEATRADAVVRETQVGYANNLGQITNLHTQLQQRAIGPAQQDMQELLVGPLPQNQYWAAPRLLQQQQNAAPQPARAMPYVRLGQPRRPMQHMHPMQAGHSNQLLPPPTPRLAPLSPQSREVYRTGPEHFNELRVRDALMEELGGPERRLSSVPDTPAPRDGVTGENAQAQMARWHRFSGQPT